MKGLITHFFKVMGAWRTFIISNGVNKVPHIFPLPSWKVALKKEKMYYLKDSDNVDELCESDVDQWMDNTRPCHPKFKIKNKLK